MTGYQFENPACLTTRISMPASLVETAHGCSDYRVGGLESGVGSLHGGIMNKPAARLSRWERDGLALFQLGYGRG